MEIGKSGTGSTGTNKQVEGNMGDQAPVGGEAPNGWEGAEAPDGTRVKAKGHTGADVDSSQNSGTL